MLLQLQHVHFFNLSHSVQVQQRCFLVVVTATMQKVISIENGSPSTTIANKGTVNDVRFKTYRFVAFVVGKDRSSVQASVFFLLQHTWRVVSYSFSLFFFPPFFQIACLILILTCFSFFLLPVLPFFPLLFFFICLAISSSHIYIYVCMRACAR